MHTDQNCSVVKNRDGSSSSQAYSKSTFTNKRKLKGNLVVQDDIEEGAVHVEATVVLQEAQLPEFIHEETHP